MRKILLLLLITSFTFGQDINTNFREGTIMFKLKNFVEAKDTSNKILDGIGIEENIEDYPVLSQVKPGEIRSVSYTHLTLPTILRV